MVVLTVEVLSPSRVSKVPPESTITRSRTDGEHSYF